MLTDFADSEKASEQHYTTWTCALSPDAVDDYAQAIKLAHHAVEKEPGKQQYLTGLGAILMRSDQYAAAKVELEKALEASDATGTSAGYALYFLAMTQHHLGHEQATAARLKDANECAAEELAESPTWNRKLTLELLRKETEALIERPNGASAKGAEASSEVSKSTSLPE